MHALALGDRILDITDRALVMGILNRTPDSFYDRGATFALHDLVGRAEGLVADGADILDVGGVKAGPGPEVGEDEELERVIPAVAAMRARFDVPLSVDTWRAAVAREAYAAGAVMGNDISGFADPAYLPTAAAAGATVVATHIRLGPRRTFARTWPTGPRRRGEWVSGPIGSWSTRASTWARPRSSR
jgi:dihydropteroate synthase